MKLSYSMLRLLFALAVLCAPALAQAQIAPPTGPVTFCGQQASPAADSYTVVVDGAAPQPLTMTAPPAPVCSAGQTHSFTLPAALFTIGTHRVSVVSTNSFGSTVGPEYIVVVGIRPGAFTVTAVIPPSGE